MSLNILKCTTKFQKVNNHIKDHKNKDHDAELVYYIILMKLLPFGVDVFSLFA